MGRRVRLFGPNAAAAGSAMMSTNMCSSRMRAIPATGTIVATRCAAIIGRRNIKVAGRNARSAGRVSKRKYTYGTAPTHTTSKSSRIHHGSIPRSVLVVTAGFGLARTATCSPAASIGVRNVARGLSTSGAFAARVGDATPNHAFDRTPESMAALRGRSLGGAGQGER